MQEGRSETDGDMMKKRDQQERDDAEMSLYVRLRHRPHGETGRSSSGSRSIAPLTANESMEGRVYSTVQFVQRSSSALRKNCKMSGIDALKDVQWLFFDVFGTVVDCNYHGASPSSSVTDLSPSTGKSHMAKSMLKVCKRVEPDLAEKNPDSKDEVWQDRVQQWRNEFMKNARERQGDREKGGMDVSISAWIYTLVLNPYQEGHRMLLDKLLEEWKVSDAWDENARDGLVKEWHKLQGSSPFSFRYIVADALIRLVGLCGGTEETARKVYPVSLQWNARLLGLTITSCSLTNGDLAVMISMCRGAGLVVDSHIT